jgi:hypothetical protein
MDAYRIVVTDNRNGGALVTFRTATSPQQKENDVSQLTREYPPKLGFITTARPVSR